MMKKINTLIILSVGLLLMSCSSDEDTTVHFTATVDGELYEGTEIRAWKSGENFGITAYNEAGDELDFYVSSDKVKKDAKITGENFSGGYDADALNIYDSTAWYSSAKTGELTFKRHNEESGPVSGTFKFDAYRMGDKDGDMITVSDGSFYVKEIDK